LRGRKEQAVCPKKRKERKKQIHSVILFASYLLSLYAYVCHNDHQNVYLIKGMIKVEKEQESAPLAL